MSKSIVLNESTSQTLRDLLYIRSSIHIEISQWINDTSNDIVLELVEGNIFVRIGGKNVVTIKINNAILTFRFNHLNKLNIPAFDTNFDFFDYINNDGETNWLECILRLYYDNYSSNGCKHKLVLDIVCLSLNNILGGNSEGAYPKKIYNQVFSNVYDIPYKKFLSEYKKFELCSIRTFYLFLSNNRMCRVTSLHQISKDAFDDTDAYFTVLRMLDKVERSDKDIDPRHSIKRLHGNISLEKRKYYLSEISDELKKPIELSDEYEVLFGGSEFEIIRSTYDLRRIGLVYGNCLYNSLLDANDIYVIYKDKYILNVFSLSNQVIEIRGKYNQVVPEEVKEELYELLSSIIKQHSLDLPPLRGLTKMNIFEEYNFIFPNID